MSHTADKLLPSKAIVVIALFAAVIAIALLSFWFLQDSELAIVFVVPEGTRGTVILYEDEAHGLSPREGGDKSLIYQLPKGSRIPIQNLAPFQRYHALLARYTNGHALSTTGELGNSADDIVLRYVGSRVGRDREVVLHIGTYSEYLKVRADFGFEHGDAIRVPRTSRESD